MIYLVEDDPNIRKLVAYALAANGFAVKDFASGSDFWLAMKQESPQLILLDIMLPGEDGLGILKKLRQSPDWQKISVMMLSALSGEFDKVTGLDSGADDYLTKPFGMMELLSRVKALLRRTESAPAEYVLDKLTVCPARHSVTLAGESLSLSLKEYDLLLRLIEAGGEVLSRDRLLNDVWAYEFDGESRTVDVHIRRLRQKLGESAYLIETVKGVGYKIGGAHHA